MLLMLTHGRKCKAYGFLFFNSSKLEVEFSPTRENDADRKKLKKK